jgi:predicted ATP-dependent endonuclease of OLD family
MFLYVNNFRGFMDTVIPIKDINFFVGENSTGKTSILKLIKILSGGQVWFRPDFTSPDINFHLFNDICNTNNIKNKEINIGIYQFEKPTQSAIVLNFFPKNNLTTLKGFRYISKTNSLNIEVIFGENKKAKIRYKSFGEADIVDVEWLKENDLKEVPFEEFQSNFGNLDSESNFLHPIIFALSDAMNYIRLKEDKKSDAGGIAINHLTQPEIVWSAPIRSEPKRTYDNYLPSFKSDGSHIPYILRDLLSKSNKDSKLFLSYLNSFGKASGLFDEIIVKEYSDENTAPFEIDILLNGLSVNLINVGYGVSQVLPILVEILTRKKDMAFAIQQPEIHLHPKGQAAMGEFFYNSWISEKKKFFIETHSDYLIDRFRISMNKNKRNYKKQKGKCQILFFTRTPKGNKVTSIEIEADGKYAEEKPKEFRDFFVKEELDILSLY